MRTKLRVETRGTFLPSATAFTYITPLCAGSDGLALTSSGRVKCSLLASSGALRGVPAGMGRLRDKAGLFAGVGWELGQGRSPSPETASKMYR
jgi:hypothetical protein